MCYVELYEITIFIILISLGIGVNFLGKRWLDIVTIQTIFFPHVSNDVGIY